MESSDEAYIRLNNAVVSGGKRLAEATGGTLYLVAAYKDGISDTQLESEGSESERIAHSFGIDEAKVIFKSGAAKPVILAAARDIEVDVLVIGTSARRGLAGALIGNTAEKVLSEVDCDILAVS